MVVLPLGCLLWRLTVLQQLTVAGNVAALCQLSERDVGGDDADEQREKARGQCHEAERIGDGACRQPGDERQASTVRTHSAGAAWSRGLGRRGERSMWITSV